MAFPAERLATALAGRYRLERELGEGGMATVYLAQDLKHHRNVALKVLRPELAAILGAERFLKEIEVTANLQHPNILPLYDSGEADTFLYYVMPHVEGESLRQKMDREKQLPVEETVEIAKAVAGALQYAHEHGVVHRDIKPENILLQSGQPLVADFGIALAVSQAGGTRLTETGLSLGTPHYMSPEQATGDRELDARSDIYSLGALVYEMLTGEPPHVGKSVQAIVAKILSERPSPISRTRDLVPPNVDAAVQRALAKSPADRFTSASKFAEALTNPAFTLPTIPTPPAARAVPASRIPGRTGVGAMAVAAVAIVLALWGWFGPRPERPRPVLQYSLAFPATEQIGFERGSRVVLSPDGFRLVYIGASQGEGRLWVRPRDQLNGTAIAVTTPASHIFFSPDGFRIGFQSAEPVSSVRVASLGGGPPLTVADSGVGLDGATWSADGYIYFDGFTGTGTTGLVRVRPGGGPRELVTTVDTAKGERDHVWPEALPGGKGVLFTVIRSLTLGESDVAVVAPGQGAHRILVRGIAARYAKSGHLVYVTANGVLMAAPFDIGKLAVTGEAVALAEGVAVRAFGAVDVTLSETGTLAYVRGGQATAPAQVVRVTREGRATVVDSGWAGDFRTLAISPDGRELAVSIVQGGEHQLWVKQLPRGPLSKLTFEGVTNYRPAWTRDGRSVAFISSRLASPLSAWAKRADGSAGAQVLRADSLQAITEVTWSRDGQWLVYVQEGRLMAWRPRGDTNPLPLMVSAQGRSTAPAVSPDGRWLAYVSDESGRPEVYVRPFPNTADAKWQISTAGGGLPQWAPNGRELFHGDFAGRLVAVEVVAGTTFITGERHTLFPTSGFRGGLGAYDVLPDGQGFVMIRQNLGMGDATEVIVVENVFQVLKEKIR